MKKLKHNVILTVSKEVQEELKKDEDYEFPEMEKVTVEIYHLEDRENTEVYKIKVPALDDDFDIEIDSDVMDISRQIEEEGGGSVEEFIFEIVMQTLHRDAEEKEARDFFEEISD